jgi:hypothetical protein
MDALELETTLQQICPSCGRQMFLSRQIKWDDYGYDISQVFECALCKVAVTEAGIPSALAAITGQRSGVELAAPPVRSVLARLTSKHRSGALCSHS